MGTGGAAQKKTNAGAQPGAGNRRGPATAPAATRTLLVAADTTHEDVRSFLPALCHALEARSLGHRVWKPEPAASRARGVSRLDDVDAVIVLGGDGTLMYVIRALGYPATPFYGVNYGQVGFLMNPRMEPAALAELLDRAEFVRVAYPVLEAELTLDDGSTLEEKAFNDFVLERASGQTVHLRTTIDGVLLNRYSGDGLIVATSGGSSAYSLAAGGPVVHHAVEGMIVTPLYPHRPVQFHSLQFSILLPLGSSIEVVAEGGEKRPVRFVADGRSIERVVAVRIAHRGLHVNLLREPTYQFIDTLVRKIIGRQGQRGLDEESDSG